MIKKTLFFVAFLIMCFGCDEESDSTPKPQSNSINKILPLGASRVEGLDLNMKATGMNFGKVNGN